MHSILTLLLPATAAKLLMPRAAPAAGRGRAAATAAAAAAAGAAASPKPSAVAETQGEAVAAAAAGGRPAASSARAALIAAPFILRSGLNTRPSKGRGVVRRRGASIGARSGPECGIGSRVQPPASSAEHFVGGAWFRNHRGSDRLGVKGISRERPSQPSQLSHMPSLDSLRFSSRPPRQRPR
eukprot:248183-Chlamydomonas_euryale.AAC.3